MDKFFDSMAEAVQTVVLIATDVEYNEKLAINLVPAAKVVKQCTDVLVSIGREVAQQWAVALEDPGQQAKTAAAAEGTMKAAEEIVSSCQMLHASPKDQPGKARLLTACKDILRETTLLLQMTDLYETLKLIKWCEMSLTVCTCLVDEVRVMSDYQTVANDINFGLPEVQKQVATRIGFLENFEYKRRLTDANLVLKQHHEPFLAASRSFLSDQRHQPTLASEWQLLKAALEEIILVAKLACRDLMDRLNMAFDPLLHAKVALPAEAKKPWEDFDVSGRDLDHGGRGGDLDGAARRLREALKKLLEGAHPDNKRGAAEALLALKAANSNLPIPEALTAALREMLTNPSKEAKLRLEEAARKYCSDGVEPDQDWNDRKGQESGLDDALRRLREKLQQLKDATEAGRLPEALQEAQALARDVVPNLLQQAERAKLSNLTSPEEKARIAEKQKDVREAAAALLEAAGRAAKDPSQLQGLLDALERLKRAAKDLAGACPAAPPSELRQLVDRAKEHAAVVPPLAAAGKRQDAETLAGLVEKEGQRAGDLAAGRAFNAELADAALQPKDDPFRSAGLDAALKRLRDASAALRGATGNATAAPGDEALQRALREEAARTVAALEAVGRAGELSPEERAVDGAGALDAACERDLAQAAKGDRPGVAATNADIARLLEAQLPALDALAAAAKDPTSRAAIEGARGGLADTVPRLRRAAETVAALPASSPERAGQLAELQQLVDRVKAHNAAANAAALAGASGDLEAELAREKARMAREIQALNQAIRNGDEAAAAAAAANIRDSAAKQRILAKALAARTTDPKLKKRLLDAALEVQAATEALLASALPSCSRTIAGLAAPGSRLLAASDSLSAAAKEASAGAPPPEPPRDQLDAAAADMRAATRNLVVDGSAEGKLFGLAKTLAEEMEKLSRAAKAGDNKQIILISRAIAALLAQVLQFSNEAAERCVDKRLSETMLTHATAAKNFATQLKILTAVKATTSAEDPSVKQQLVKCAKMLTNHMIKTVNAAEISKLRAKK